MKLYTYFRSSAAYRVRIALALKGIAFESAFVPLRTGAQHAADYVALHPQHFVPTLIDDGNVLTQSLAQIEYLDETRPAPPFLPDNPLGRARVRALALTIACDIHPLNNLRVLKHLGSALGQSSEGQNDWYRHWIAEGLGPLERMLADSEATGLFCHGDRPGLADICLVPQVYNAERYNCPLDAYPTIRRINQACRELPEFAEAAPERQPDAAE